VALGWATFDETRAWRELEKLVEGQWDDGMLPHIIFHAPSDQYFPGPDVWGTHHHPPTSGITQPPVLATSIRLLLENATDVAQAGGRALPRHAGPSLVGQGARPARQRVGCDPASLGIGHG
jgi:hypothetical protein